MIVDTHIHYAEPASAERPYVDDGFKRDQKEMMSVEDLLAEAVSAGVDRIVQITPSYMGWDNRYGLEGALRHPDRVLGVFGRLDPIAPDVERRLRELIEQPGMIGVRIQPRARDASSRWLRERALDGLFAAAERLDVPVGCYAQDQPRELRDTARRFPGLRLIAEHITLHTKGTGDPFAFWPDVLELVAEPNVWGKVSLFPEAAPKGERFPFPTSLRFFKDLYERVGAERLIWGSNYAPVTRVCSYRESLDFIRTASDFLTEKDKAAILGGNFLAAFSGRTTRRN